MSNCKMHAKLSNVCMLIFFLWEQIRKKMLKKYKLIKQQLQLFLFCFVFFVYFFMREIFRNSFF